MSEETRVRMRYVDLIVRPEARTYARLRPTVLRSLRETFHNQDFIEVETPMLQVMHGGAAARPFKSFSNAYDMDLYLRIAPELFLKRCVVGGIERVFEINRNFRNEGKHDLIHCLGVSIMEYAVLFSDIQKAIRKYHNPKLQITFDCASPFFSAAKGLAYFNNSIEHDKKWAYSMEKTAEKKSYANDNRKYSDAVLQDKIHDKFTDSPVTDLMLLKDLCYRGQGFIGQHGKETKTSWDTLSYTLLQSHNVYMHMTAVQEANRQYDKGVMPKMVMSKFDDEHFGEIVDKIFAQKDRQKSLDMIESHSSFWMQMKSGSQGLSGKKAMNAMTMFDQLFDVTDSEPEVEEAIEDSDDEISKVLGE